MGSVNLNSAGTTAILGIVASARCGALVVGRGGGVVAKNDTAVAFLAVLDTGEGVTIGSAGGDTGGGSHGVYGELLLAFSDGASVVGVVGVAADGLERADNVGLDVGERRISPDGEGRRATATLGLVSSAFVAAGRFIELGAVDSSTAVADAKVGEAGVAVPVALAFGGARLGGCRGLVDGGAEVKSFVALGTLLGIAARVDIRLEGAEAWRQLNSGRGDLSKEGSSCESSHGSDERSHFERVNCGLVKKEWTGLLRKAEEKNVVMFPERVVCDDGRRRLGSEASKPSIYSKIRSYQRPHGGFSAREKTRGRGEAPSGRRLSGVRSDGEDAMTKVNAIS